MMGGRFPPDGIIKGVLRGALCGLLMGTLILGVGGRLVMRLIALLSGATGGFSLGGTLEVVVFGALVGLVAGCFYPLVLAYLPERTLWSGTLTGLLVFVLLLIIPFESKLAAKGFPELMVPIYLLFGFICLLFGIVSVAVFRRSGPIRK